MTANEVVQLIISICTLIGMIGGLIPTVIALVSKIKEIVKNKDWKLVEKMALEAMSTVEKYAKEHPEMTSDDKLNMAIEAVKAGMKAADVAYDDKLIGDLVEYIKAMCGWSKTVNH